MKITSQSFMRLMKYASRQHLNDVVNFLQTNQLDIVADLPTIQSILTPEVIHLNCCDCFVKACYYLHYGRKYCPETISIIEQSYVEEFKRFDINQLLLNGSDKVKINEYNQYNRNVFEFNFTYIHKVIDQVAHEYGYDFIPWAILKDLSLNIKELNQGGVVLINGQQGEASHYECCNIVTLFYHYQYNSYSQIRGMYLKMEK